MQFEPKLERTPGGSSDEWTYKDRDVHAVLISDLLDGCQILELSSHRPGQGHAKAAVTWLRQRFGSVSVFLAHDPNL